MSWLRRLFCRAFGHVTPPGISPRYSFRFECARCLGLVDGELAGARRR